MLVIRFFRAGKRKQPFYKIVVTDKRRAPRGGRFTEEVGFFNPLTKEKKLKSERIKYWIEKGAKPSDTVFNLLVKEKIIDGKKIPVHKKSKKPIENQAPVASQEKSGNKEKQKEVLPQAEINPEEKNEKENKTEEKKENNQ